MYRLGALLDKQPIQIAGAVSATLNLLVVAKVVRLAPEVVAGANSALLLWLGLFVSTKTENRAKLSELVDKTKK